jgi:hypothetical protein
MFKYVRFPLLFLGGAAVGALALLLALPPARPAPNAPLGAIPSDREALLVLKWVLENHPDARDLTFLAWSPPEPVEDNPITHQPAVFVRVTWRKNQGKAEVEEHPFYLKGDLVLAPKAQSWRPPRERPQPTESGRSPQPAAAGLTPQARPATLSIE